MQAEQQSERERFEVELIEQTALRVGMKSLMNNGAASCVYSEGCNGVSQEHLIAFAREVALHCVAALSHHSTPKGWKLVPVRATQGMVDTVASEYLAEHGYDDEWVRHAWESMLRRAPPPPEQGGKG